MASKNVETAIEHLVNSFNEHDADRAVAAYSPGVRFTIHGRGTEVGPEAVRRSHLETFSSFPDVRADMVSVVDAGDVVVLEFDIAGTNDGPMGDQVATGRRFQLRMCDVIRFDDNGKIVAEDNYVDQLTMMMQLGLVPAPARPDLKTPG